jgi:hypothetical protein
MSAESSEMWRENQSAASNVAIIERKRQPAASVKPYRPVSAARRIIRRGAGGWRSAMAGGENEEGENSAG